MRLYPSLVRPFGVQLPAWLPFDFREKKRALQRLTFRQHVLIKGVLGWGFLMFVYMTVWHYLDWKFWNASVRQPSIEGILVDAGFWLVCGASFGAVSWKAKKSRNAQPSNLGCL
jgi:hypothetical protein